MRGCAARLDLASDGARRARIVYSFECTHGEADQRCVEGTTSVIIKATRVPWIQHVGGTNGLVQHPSLVAPAAACSLWHRANLL